MRLVITPSVAAAAAAEAPRKISVFSHEASRSVHTRNRHPAGPQPSSDTPVAVLPG